MEIGALIVVSERAVASVLSAAGPAAGLLNLKHFLKVGGMEETSFLNKIMLNLRATCRYYTGFPKDLGPSRVIHFTSEREFVQLLHQGHPVVVAFTIKCNLTKHLDKVLDEAAAEFDPHVKFMRAANQGKAIDPNITKYSVRVLPFNYDLSAYGFREFFKRHGIARLTQLSTSDSPSHTRNRKTAASISISIFRFVYVMLS
ncbi:UNVERIFIED_CONTAM: hypothetical protein Scaly_1988200 [Sesamum calycinum]|uniref:Thioredoxin superfamily protein n=1 Tax=Sesamum calycinum TaxID=2727403 RepID=A0AAW2N3P6_9LAMI